MKNNEAIDLTDLISRYGDDQKCRNYLEHLRWKDGIRCPKCNGTKISSILKRDQHNCDSESCGHQFSVTAGTLFHYTPLPLSKKFLSIFPLCQSRQGKSGDKVKRMLGGKYQTGLGLLPR